MFDRQHKQSYYCETIGLLLNYNLTMTSSTSFKATLAKSSMIIDQISFGKWETDGIIYFWSK